MSPTLPGPPSALVDALRSGCAVAVVGSGVSRASGAPDWDGLIAALADEAVRLRPRESASVREARALLEKGAYLDSASVLKDILGTEFARAVTRVIEGVRDPSLSHQILMHLPFRAIVTTNYDRLLELAAVPACPPPSWYWSDPDLSTRIREGSRFILKLHGDVQRPETIVLAREDYSRCVNDERTREALRTLLGANTPFYVGYGHRDPDLDTLLDAQRERVGLDGGYALVAGEDIARDTRLRKARIFGVQLETHADVPAFLLSLAFAVGIRLKLSLTLVTDVDWTTPEAAEQLGHRLAQAVGGHLGCDAVVREVRPGSVIVVIELPGPAAVDALLRIERHDRQFVGLLLECGVTSAGRIRVEADPTTQAPACVVTPVGRDPAQPEVASEDVRRRSTVPAAVRQELPRSRSALRVPGAGRGPSAATLVALVAAVGGLGGLAAILNWMKPAPPMCIAGEVRDCTALVPCQSKGVQVCVSAGRSWSECRCPPPASTAATTTTNIPGPPPISTTPVLASSTASPVAASPCPGPLKLTATRIPGANKAQVTLSPMVAGFEYTVHIIAPNDESYSQRFAGESGLIRLGEAATTGTFTVHASSRGSGKCSAQHSNSVQITLE